MRRRPPRGPLATARLRLDDGVGGLGARRARRILFLHLLALAWGIYVLVTPGLVCPLTPLENTFALRAGTAGYEGSFIEQYLVPIIYPEGLSPLAQWVLAGVVVGINACVYVWPRCIGSDERQKSDG
jgi:hypothetical protein